MARTRSQGPSTPTKQTASTPKTPRTPKKAAPKPSDLKIKKATLKFPIPKKTSPTLKKKTSPTPPTHPPSKTSPPLKKRKSPPPPPKTSPPPLKEVSKSTKKPKQPVTTKSPSKTSKAKKSGISAYLQEEEVFVRVVVHAPRTKKAELEEAVRRALEEVVVAGIKDEAEREETEAWFARLGQQKEFKQVAVLFRIQEV